MICVNQIKGNWQGNYIYTHTQKRSLYFERGVCVCVFFVWPCAFVWVEMGGVHTEVVTLIILEEGLWVGKGRMER